MVDTHTTRDGRCPSVVFLISQTPDPRMHRRMGSMVDAGWTVSALCWDRGGDVWSADIPGVASTWIRTRLHRAWGIPGRAAAWLEVAGRCLSWLVRLPEPVSLIYTAGTEMMLPALVYRFLRTRHHMRVVYEIADLPVYDYVDNGHWLALPAARLVDSWVSHADRVVLTSPYFWSDHYQRLIPWGRVIVAENLPSRDEFAAFVPQQHDVFTVLSLGKIQYLDELRTLCDVMTTEPGTQAIVAGGGPGYEAIRAYARDMSNIAVTGPFRHGPAVRDLYARADLVYCVYPTRLRNVRSALPNKLYEAMACHIPIVVSAGTRLSEYVRSHEAGYSVRPGSPDDLRDLVKRLRDERAEGHPGGGYSRAPLFWEDVKTGFVANLRGLVDDA